MKKVIHRADSRGQAKQGWLNSHHTFSFSHYHHPERMGFGKLRVLNDDIVQPSKGFDTHLHDNMEIVSIPLSGRLRHKDNMGHEHVISCGEVQIMSAGTGITHSEYNDSSTQAVNFLQIWVLPKEKNIQPRYEQKPFAIADTGNQFKMIVSPNQAREETVWINQDAYFSFCTLEAKQSAHYSCQLNDPALYLFLISGQINLDGDVLHDRDGMALSDLTEITLTAHHKAKILCIETTR